MILLVSSWRLDPVVSKVVRHDAELADRVHTALRASNRSTAALLIPQLFMLNDQMREIRYGGFVFYRVL